MQATTLYQRTVRSSKDEQKKFVFLPVHSAEWEIKPGCYKVFAAISACSYKKGDERICTRNMKTIAKFANLDRRTVSAALKSLLQKGLVTQALRDNKKVYLVQQITGEYAKIYQDSSVWGLNPLAFLVWVALKSFTSAQSSAVFPGDATLMRRAGLRTVENMRNGLKELAGCGAITQSPLRKGSRSLKRNLVVNDYWRVAEMTAQPGDESAEMIQNQKVSSSLAGAKSNHENVHIPTGECRDSNHEKVQIPTTISVTGSEIGIITGECNASDLEDSLSLRSWNLLRSSAGFEGLEELVASSETGLAQGDTTPVFDEILIQAEESRSAPLTFNSDSSDLITSDHSQGLPETNPMQSCPALIEVIKPGRMTDGLFTKNKLKSVEEALELMSNMTKREREQFLLTQPEQLRDKVRKNDRFNQWCREDIEAQKALLKSRGSK